MTCKEATYLHEKKKDGKLSFGERLGLFIHLLYCHLCRLFIKQSEELEESVRNLAETTGNATLSPSAKQKMHETLLREPGKQS